DASGGAPVMLLTEVRPANLDMGADQYEWPGSEAVAAEEDRISEPTAPLSLVDLPVSAGHSDAWPVRSYIVPAEGIDLSTVRFGLDDHYLVQIAPQLMRSIEQEEMESGRLLCWPEDGETHDKPKILYVGPVGYREGVWDTRVKYIFPDL